jgi:DNA-binding NtrC family response regulator
MRREILVVDDDQNLRLTLQELLESADYAVRVAADGHQAEAMNLDAAPDLILCDWKMPVAGGEHLLRQLKQGVDGGQTPIIIMTAHGNGPNAMKAMELGAYDFVTKPLDADEVLASIERAIKHADLQREVDELRRQRFQSSSGEEQIDHSKARLIGGSPAWLEVFKAVGRVARTDVSVLLQGESGTGKEVVAHTIHENSARSRKPFIVVNCATLPPELMESELFGHERGSFTGALAQKPGKFEAAAGGTVFLDEIGELPLSLQPKLLRVLQEHTFERIGGTRSLEADFRVIAATNRNLEEEVEEKTFRADLYYRLQAFTIQLPPLRERRSDILPLAEHFLARFASRNGRGAPGLTEDAVLALQQYPFHGNVRELEHMMDRAAVQTGGRAITAEFVRDLTAGTTGAKPTIPSLSELQSLPFHESVAAWEKLLITNALQIAKGNKSDAARQLGVNRRLLYEKMQQLKIG